MDQFIFDGLLLESETHCLRGLPPRVEIRVGINLHLN